MCTCVCPAQCLRRSLPCATPAADAQPAPHAATPVVFLDFERSLYVQGPTVGAADSGRSSGEVGTAEDAAAVWAGCTLRPDLACDGIHLNAGVVPLLQACLQRVPTPAA